MLRISKKCRLCGESKTLEHFYRNDRYLDGFRHECRECLREIEHNKPDDVLEHRREVAKRWRLKNKEYMNRKGGEWKESHPEVVMAARAVQKALKNGSLIRPESCSLCGKVCKPDAHHDDHTRPLDVIWCCRKCHAALTKKNRDAKQNAKVSAA